MAYADPEVGKARDRERFHRRVARRLAAGFCTRCGRRPPETGRKVCGECAEKKRIAGRQRDARLRAARLPRRDPAKAKAYERERSHREAAQRREAGLCVRCGKAPAEPQRALCEGCLVKRRASDRARYGAARAAGRLYGGKDPQVKRASARAASRKRQQARLAAGSCTRCGRRPPAGGSTACEPCRTARREADRELYAARKSAGLCVKCAAPTHGGATRCAPCSALESERDLGRKNAAARRRYQARKTAGRCTDCNAPSHGAARCEPCARRSYERSDHFRGLPIYPPVFTVVLMDSDVPLGTFDDEMDVAAYLAFEKLSADQIEVLVEASPILRYAAWE